MTDKLIAKSVFLPSPRPAPFRVHLMQESERSGPRRAIFPSENFEYIAGYRNESVIKFAGAEEIVVHMSLEDLEERFFNHDGKEDPVLDLTAETSEPKPKRAAQILPGPGSRGRHISDRFLERARERDASGGVDLAAFMAEMMHNPPKDGAFMVCAEVYMNQDDDTMKRVSFNLNDVETAEECALFPEERTFIALKDKTKMSLAVTHSVYKTMVEDAKAAGRNFLVINKQPKKEDGPASESGPVKGPDFSL